MMKPEVKTTSRLPLTTYLWQQSTNKRIQKNYHDFPVNPSVPTSTHYPVFKTSYRQSLRTILLQCIFEQLDLKLFQPEQRLEFTPQRHW